MTVLLTGASGFLGKAILNSALKLDLKVRPVYRSVDAVNFQPGAVYVPGLDGIVNWSEALHGVSVVIHSAARTHIMREAVFDSLAQYHQINVLGTLNLARQAANEGVRRFIFISSIKVNGEVTAPGCPFTADDDPAPEDAYGESKAETEKELKLLAKTTGMEVTIIRPPLIYGPGVKGNFATLIYWTRRGFPLPLAGLTQNRRSMVGVDNLVDLIFVCAKHPKAANQTFLVSDGEDLSTTEFLKKLSRALQQPSRLIWIPPWLISSIARLLGKEMLSQRLLGSLQVDIQKTCVLLDWKPLLDVDQGLCRTVE